MITANSSSQNLSEKTRSINLSKNQKEDSNDLLFEKAIKGNIKAFETLIEAEKPMLFDFALRMTGDINRSLESIQDFHTTMDSAVLNHYTTLFIMRQSLLQGIRKTCKSLWHNDTSRLENAFYSLNSNAHTENLKDLSVPENIKIREFEREFRLLPGLEREALWLKARLDATPEQVAQVMEIKTSEAEAHLVHALFRLENKSFGQDPESLVAQLPLHPLPAPVSNVTMDLSMVMQGIKNGQKPPKQSRVLTFSILILTILCCLLAVLFIFRDEMRQQWSNLSPLMESPPQIETPPPTPPTRSLPAGGG